MSTSEKLVFGRLSLSDRMSLLDHPAPGKGIGGSSYEYSISLDSDRKEWVRTDEWEVGLLKELGFTGEQADQAMFGINLINEGTNPAVSPSSHYRTRAELEKVSGPVAVQLMIENGIIKLHSKWYNALRNTNDLGITFHRYHPQAEYKLDPSPLLDLNHPDY
jgi:hypothetical protein